MTQTIGHRGAGTLEPENTLRAFRRAAELGLDYVEFDVRRCKTEELIVMHDEELDRTTNGKGFVNEMTLQQLEKLDAGKGEKIPTLQEAIEECKGKIGMMIELKEEGLEEDVVSMLDKYEVRAIITSFFHERIKKAKELARIKGLIVKTGAINSGSAIDPVALIRLADADVYVSDHYYMDERTAKLLKEAGILLAIGGCKNKREVQKALGFEADMLSSDTPDLLIKVLNGRIC